MTTTRRVPWLGISRPLTSPAGFRKPYIDATYHEYLKLLSPAEASYKRPKLIAYNVSLDKDDNQNLPPL